MADNSVSFRSFNFPDRFIRHRNFLAEIEPVSSDLDRLDATFIFHPGLASQFGTGTASWESRNLPGFWLRHHDFRLKLQKRPSPESAELALFNKDATFFIVDGLASSSGRNKSFRSVNFNTRLLRHRDFHLFLDEVDVSKDIDRKDATFEIRDGFVPEV